MDFFLIRWITVFLFLPLIGFVKILAFGLSAFKIMDYFNGARHKTYCNIDKINIWNPI